MSASSDYDRLSVIMKKVGATVAPVDFYWAVNKAYHSAEANLYDDVHAGMFQGLGVIWQRLVKHIPPGSAKLRILDVGAGTGLVAGYLAEICPDRIASMTLLDPCKAMLERCQTKASKWPFPVEFVEGDINALPSSASYDVITINSVLHHIVELESFCRKAAGIVRDQGTILTAQDSASGAETDNVLAKRRDEARSRRISPRPRFQLARRILAKLTGRSRPDPLALNTNAALLKSHVIRRPLDLGSIWAVTDFHVQGQPGNFGAGIPMTKMKEWMSPLQLKDFFTYEFYGYAWDRLTESEQRQEMDWLTADDPHGRLFASAWANR